MAGETGAAGHFILVADQESLDYCMIEDYPQGMEAIHRPAVGVRMNERYRESMGFRMSSTIGGKVVPDLVRNALGYCIASARLRELLEGQAGVEIEFLPMHIINHKGRREKGEFFIGNVIGSVDCVDRGRSEFVENPMRPGEFQFLRKLALATDRIDPERKLFRIRPMPRVLIIREDLASLLGAAGVTGCSFLRLGSPVRLG